MTTTRTPERLDWADLAKAACILLVVLYHSANLTPLIAWQGANGSLAFWDMAARVLTPLRMPLFFLVSGLLAAPSLRRNWEDMAAKRVAQPLYLYLVWSVLFLAFVPLWPSFGVDMVPLGARLADLAMGNSIAWYLWALPAFFIFALATRRLQLWVPLTLALALAIASTVEALPLSFQSRYMMRCLVFFVIGIRMPALPALVASLASWRRLLALSALFAIALAVTLDRGGSFGPAVDLLAVLTGVMLAALAAARFPLLARWGRWLGSRTLPIYLLHFVFLALLPPALAQLPAALLASAPFQAAFPLAATAIAVAGSLATHQLLLAAGGRWLFALPRLERPAKTAPAEA